MTSLFDKMTRFNFYLPTELLACLREQAIYRQKPLAALIREILERTCQKDETP